MKILLTNDDSIHSPGLILLAEKLGENHEVFVVAPRTEQSGVSQAITFLRPLFPEPIEGLPATSGINGYTVDGTPADCVKLALAHLCPWTPDLVVSGINNGLNVGTNVNYSGTVAGALAAGIMGITGMAVSAQFCQPTDFASHVEILVPLIEQFAEVDLESPVVLNINVPTSALKGGAKVKVVPIEANPLGYRFEEGVDPKGRVHYWANCKPDPEPSPFDTDFSVLSEGCISVSPLSTNLNTQKGIEAIAKIAERASAECSNFGKPANA